MPTPQNKEVSRSNSYFQQPNRSVDVDPEVNNFIVEASQGSLEVLTCRVLSIERERVIRISRLLSVSISEAARAVLRAGLKRVEDAVEAQQSAAKAPETQTQQIADSAGGVA